MERVFWYVKALALLTKQNRRETSTLDRMK
jgi:hypothetical protein